MISAFLTALLTTATPDCSVIAPFTPIDSQIVAIDIARFYWTTDVDGNPIQEPEDVCSKDVVVPGYDIRNREADAYYCLTQPISSVAVCDTTWNGDPAVVGVRPASWIRIWTGGARRDFHFHAYVSKETAPDSYIDLFARTLTKNLEPQPLILEGATKNGPQDRTDTFFVRAEYR